MHKKASQNQRSCVLHSRVWHGRQHSCVFIHCLLSLRGQHSLTLIFYGVLVFLLIENQLICILFLFVCLYVLLLLKLNYIFPHLFPYNYIRNSQS